MKKVRQAQLAGERLKVLLFALEGTQNLQLLTRSPKLRPKSARCVDAESNRLARYTLLTQTSHLQWRKPPFIRRAFLAGSAR